MLTKLYTCSTFGVISRRGNEHIWTQVKTSLVVNWEVWKTFMKVSMFPFVERKYLDDSISGNNLQDAYIQIMQRREKFNTEWRNLGIWHLNPPNFNLGRILFKSEAAKTKGVYWIISKISVASDNIYSVYICRESFLCSL